MTVSKNLLMPRRKDRSYPFRCRDCDKIIINADDLKATLSNGQRCRACEFQKRQEYMKRYRISIKIRALEHYSVHRPVRCSNCPIDDLRVLTLDHINGRSHELTPSKRGSGSVVGSSWYRRMVLHEAWEPDLQVLCQNCQWIKRDERGETRKSRWS